MATSSLKYLVIFAVSSFLSVTCVTATVSSIFVFGDSLADDGNNNNLNSLPLIHRSNFPYYGIDFPGRIPTGRFSNGFNGVDYIANFLGFPRGPPPYASITNPIQMLRGVNFASAGSGIQDTTGQGTINMKTQIQNFQKVNQALNQKLGSNQARRLISRSIFIIITANNDLFEYYFATGATNASTNTQFISNLASQFTQHVTNLYNLGARNFYIAGTGHIGCVPFFVSQNPSRTCIDALDQLSVQYNKVAKDRINQLSSQLSGMRYSYSDIYRMTSDIMDAPLLFGITELKKACCGGGTLNGQSQCTANANLCRNRNNYFFWDWFHPTQEIYRITSVYAFFGGPIYSMPINIQHLVTTIV